MAKVEWDNFIVSLTQATSVALVGPMCRAPYHATLPTIYVDGGTHFRDPAATLPAVSVGDGDSGNLPLDLLLPQAKDYSDLAFALSTLPKSVQHLQLIGFLGGRRDHELIGLGEVHRFLKDSEAFRTARFDQAIVAFAHGSLQLTIHGRFSTVVFEPTAVSISGDCAYLLPTAKTMAPFSSLGLSNEGYGVVRFESAGPCFILLN